jgi:predicted N-formylglutamate amidohydrolase
MPTLLSSDELQAFRFIEGVGPLPLLLLCDHASNCVPKGLHNLGLPQDELSRHIAYDIGAAAVTEKLSALLGAPALLTNYSRLVVDCNRPPEPLLCAPAISDGTPIPANQDMGDNFQARLDEVFWPYHKKIDEVITALETRHNCPATLVSLHSFTPMLRVNGKPRPWQISVLWREDDNSARKVLDFLRTHHAELTIGENEPYSMKNEVSYTLHTHGAEKRSNIMFEIRQNEVNTPEGIDKYAHILGDTLKTIMSDI